jgi:aminoglycoside 2'-N-acetyltransferase I
MALRVAARRIAERRLRVVASSELSPEEWAELTQLAEAAFREPWRAAVWEAIGPATHVIAEDDRRMVAHACYIERELHIAGRPFRTGYVEAVATHPEHEREGHGTAVMVPIGEMIREGGFEIGALSTGAHHFYERLGWECWHGPTYVRMPDGEVRRTPDEDDGVMILRTPLTPPSLDLTASISVAWRPGEVW